MPDLIEPRPLLVAVSVPESQVGQGRNCSAVEHVPARAAVVSVIEYTQNRRGKPLEPRASPYDFPADRSLAYDDGRYGIYECAGEGYAFNFRRDGRALQGQIALDRETVSPAAKAEAITVLNSLAPD
jgi:hypothetical protein